MSLNVEVGHNWISVNDVPRTLQGMYPNGACLVFADEQFVVAIPATNKQTNELADLFEPYALALDDDFTGAGADYFKMRDELCSPKGYQMLSMLFQQEVDKVEAKERVKGKLASAARAKNAVNN